VILVISNKNKFAFIHIPRTAGTSINLVLKKYCGEFVKHQSIIDVKRKLKNNFDSYLKFCVVRNPWDRAVSTYEWGIQMVSPYKKRPFWENLGFKEWAIHEFGTNGNHFAYKEQLQPQLDWITDNNGEVSVDFIGRFENLIEDWKLICEKCGFLDKLPHKHDTTRKKYQGYYDDETKELISKYFQKDIEYFGYEY